MRVGADQAVRYSEDRIERERAMSNLTVRRPNITIDALVMEGNWLGGDAFRTQIFNTMSMMFPIGEKYFIDSVRAGAESVTDGEVQRTIRLFIAQEANHSHLHRRFNARLAEQGLVNRVEARIAWRIRLGERFSVRDKLAITLAYEHFTAAFGDAVLGDAGWLDGAPPVMRAFWEWHAAEECEHRAAAFDLYRALGGGTARRMGWFFYVSLLFCVDALWQSVGNLRRSGQLWRGATWRQGLRFICGRRGVIARVGPAWLRYLRPGFHPEEKADPGVAAAWFTAHAGLFSGVE